LIRRIRINTGEIGERLGQALGHAAVPVARASTACINFSRVLSRLQRAFTTQLDSLSKLRRGGQQKVVVEHVHVYEGGQAIVGNVTHAGRGVSGGK
jgi:hypothetical protein